MAPRAVMAGGFQTRRTALLRGATAVALATLGYLSWVRPRLLLWGESADEAARPLPGDDLASDAKGLDTTRAITIAAPPEGVWPWIVQLGFGRAGWYSYDLLDNFGRPSATSIVPSLQTLQVGDIVPVGPPSGLRLAGFSLLPPGRGCRVAVLDPGRCLVMASGPFFDAAAETVTTTWTFCVEPVEGGGTRLIERIRSAGDDRLLSLPGRTFWELADFVMMRRQLLAIKARAEAAWAARPRQS